MSRKIYLYEGRKYTIGDSFRRRSNGKWGAWTDFYNLTDVETHEGLIVPQGKFNRKAKVIEG